MRLPSLTALKAFNAAAEHLSFKKAAEQLSVTPAALSFQIRQLEETLGCELFIRRSRRVTLSDEGALIQADIRLGFEHFEQALSKLKRKTQNQVLNIACGPAFSANWLSPRLHSFLLSQPRLETRIFASLALVDLRRDEVDVAVRYTAKRQPGCRVIKLADDYLVPMCSPELLRSNDPLRVPDDLASHKLIHSDSCDSALKTHCWRYWLACAGAKSVDGEGSSLHFDVPDHALNAAVAGAGVVMGREVLAQRYLESGQLVRPFDLRLKTELSFYAVVLEERVEEPAIAAFLSWISAEVEV